MPPKARNWRKALLAKERNEKQIPEEAFVDLELVSCQPIAIISCQTLTIAQLENKLKSGKVNGEPVNCTLKI